MRAGRRKTNMLNVQHRVTGAKLVIEIDLGKTAVANARPSNTGKTDLLASTGGKVDLEPIAGRRCSFALNVMLAR
jgi:hypothetical protein